MVKNYLTYINEVSGLLSDGPKYGDDVIVYYHGHLKGMKGYYKVRKSYLHNGPGGNQIRYTLDPISKIDRLIYGPSPVDPIGFVSETSISYTKEEALKKEKESLEKSREEGLKHIGIDPYQEEKWEE